MKENHSYIHGYCDRIDVFMSNRSYSIYLEMNSIK